MFASRSTRDVAIGVETVTVRKLSGPQARRARDVRNAEQVKALRDMGGDVLKALKSGELDKIAVDVKADPVARSAAERKARYDAFDRATVLTCGVVRWTCGDVTPKAIDDLEDWAAQAIHEAIVDFTFPTVEEAKAAEGNA